MTTSSLPSAFPAPATPDGDTSSTVSAPADTRAPTGRASRNFDELCDDATDRGAPQRAATAPTNAAAEQKPTAASDESAPDDQPADDAATDTPADVAVALATAIVHVTPVMISAPTLTLAPVADNVAPANANATPASPGPGNGTPPPLASGNAAATTITAAPTAPTTAPAATAVANANTNTQTNANAAATAADADGARRAPREKSAGRGSTPGATEKPATQKNFVTVAGEEVKPDSEVAGTGVALRDGAMKPAPQFVSRMPSHTDRGAARLFDASEAGPGNEFSLAWKGWTNGGGERVSTAAQFSRLGEQIVGMMPATGAATFATGRATPTAPTASATPQFPTEPAALVAPLGAAIERLLVRGNDQLAVTVRFEQGGSLSLKLALRDGEIATQIQTDVPGLEGALRSAWNTFAQDFGGRGVKLSAPTFTATPHDDASGRDNHAFGREAREGEGTPGSWLGGAHRARASRRAAQGATAPVETLRPALAAPRGLHTWA